MSIRENLYKWRDNEAIQKGIENFRVLPNSTLDEIISILPKNKDELCNIKGIKEMKFSQYGREILSILDGVEVKGKEVIETKELDKFYSVGEYLNLVNIKLKTLTAKIKGEVVSFQASGNAIYFTIKDSEQEGTLSVFMWSSDYRLSGVEITTGLEVLVSGNGEIYKPTGKFSLRASTIELVGEGALKKAYDELKNKLQKEDLFNPKNKRKIIEYPKKIGVITSKQGAVIHDFLNNLGKFGYLIKFIDSRVEGVLAIRDILASIKKMQSLDIDVLVIIRGGGSLESLQAFNNEHIVREIAKFKVPVICAIGHDKDVPLAQLAADYSPSTPSICTSLLNESWNSAKFNVETYKRTMFSKYENVIYSKVSVINRMHNYLNNYFNSLQTSINETVNGFYNSVSVLEKAIQVSKKDVLNIKNSILTQFSRLRIQAMREVEQINIILEAHNPFRLLKVGYSILYSKDKILRSVDGIIIGDEINANLSDGNIIAKITKINKNA